MRWLLVLLLVSCAPQATLEELEREALLTGDWSKVEARERRMARNAPCNRCPSDLIDYHNHWGHAGCLSRDDLRDIFR